MPDDYTPKKPAKEMPRVTVRIPDGMFYDLNELVNSGEFPTISEAIRAAVLLETDKVLEARKINPKNIGAYA